MFTSLSLSDYLAHDPVTWAENLPANTPPNEIVFADGNDDDYIYRLSLSEEGYHDDDFIPLARKPHKILEDAELIGQSFGLSSFIEEQSANNQMRLPYCRKKFKSVVKIYAKRVYGVLKNTPSSNNANHYTWWHTQEFMQELQSDRTIIVKIN